MRGRRHGPDGLGHGRAPRRRGIEVVAVQPDARRGGGLAARIGAAVAATPAEAAAAADVVDLDARRRRRGAAPLYGGPGRGCSPALRPGAVAVDMSTVLPATIRRSRRRRARAARGILDAPVSGSVGLDGRRRARRSWSAARPRTSSAPGPVLDALAKRIFHLGAAGTGAAMKLAVNAVIFGLNEAVAEGARPGRAAGIDRALAYDVLAASAVGAPYVGYKRAAFVEPETTPGRVLPRPGGQGPAPHRGAGRGVGHARCRRRPANLALDPGGGAVGRRRPRLLGRRESPA